MINKSVFQGTNRRGSLVNLRRMSRFTAKVVVFTEQFLGIALYLGSAALSILSANTLELPPTGDLPIRQAITSELLIMTPAFLTMRFRNLRWLYLPCCLFLGCTTGVLLVVLLQKSAAIWAVGILLTRLLLILSLKNRQEAWSRNLQYLILLTIGAVLKHLAL